MISSPALIVWLVKMPTHSRPSTVQYSARQFGSQEWLMNLASLPFRVASISAPFLHEHIVTTKHGQVWVWVGTCLHRERCSLCFRRQDKQLHAVPCLKKVHVLNSLLLILITSLCSLIRADDFTCKCISPAAAWSCGLQLLQLCALQAELLSK